MENKRERIIICTGSFMIINENQETFLYTFDCTVEIEKLSTYISFLHRLLKFSTVKLYFQLQLYERLKCQEVLRILRLY